jgi:hypothetical protein
VALAILETSARSSDPARASARIAFRRTAGRHHEMARHCALWLLNSDRYTQSDARRLTTDH